MLQEDSEAEEEYPLSKTMEFGRSTEASQIPGESEEVWHGTKGFTVLDNKYFIPFFRKKLVLLHNISWFSRYLGKHVHDLLWFNIELIGIVLLYWLEFHALIVFWGDRYQKIRYYNQLLLEFPDWYNTGYNSSIDD